ncbi:MAG: hypothetical protein ACRCZE_01435 [Candidatus Altimarinota bacterium]
MENTTKQSGSRKILKGVLIAIVVLVGGFLLCRYVFFAEAFDKWGEGLENISEWQENYKAENPEATKEQMDAAFSQGIADLEKWRADYKAANPGATEEDVDAAWRKAWNQ